MASTTRDNSGMLTGLFQDRDSAERAYQGLSQRGYTAEDVNVIMSEDTRKKHFGDNAPETELGSKAAEGAGVGGALGGTLGAILAAVAATGTSIAIPGLGLVIAGPIAAALAGGGAGAATGGLLGALVGAGIPEERVKHYESGLQQGGILMGVTPRSDDDAGYLEQHWRDNNGTHVYRPGSTAMGSSAADDADFRNHWKTTYGTTGGRYEDYDSAYRYGTDMAGSDRYRNYQWSEVEPQLRSDWESNNPGSTWDKVKDAVRYGAERAGGSRRH